MENTQVITLRIHHPLLAGTYTTEALNINQAIKNVVFRELNKRKRTKSNITSKALPLAAAIFDHQLYTIIPEKNEAADSILVGDPLVHDAPRPRRGDQEYPENPDDEDEDEDV